MNTRHLGRSDIEVSAMGLGCWAIGGPWTYNGEPLGWGQVDDAESIRAIHFALDEGINFFDTAANYGCGHSEILLGKAITGRRDKVILATKFGYIIDEKNRIVTRTEEVISRIHQECEASLRRLNSDYIDLYLFHKDDYDRDKAVEVREALEGLVREGKIRWYGWSTDDPESARVFAQGEHCSAIQHWLNMGYDTPQMLAVCEEYNQASINRSPLGSGLMTGKYTRDSIFPEDDMRSTWDLKAEFPTERLKRIEAVRKIFLEENRTQAQIALAWIWTRSQRTIPIPGFKTVAQVKENIQAMSFGPLMNDQMKNIDRIFGRSPAAV